MTSFDPTKDHSSEIPSTTEAGAPRESDAHSLSVGNNGPLMLHDVALVEKLARFDRERVPERSPHAKGSGAFGTVRGLRRRLEVHQGEVPAARCQDRHARSLLDRRR